MLNYEHNYTLQKVNQSYKSVVADSSLCAAQSAKWGEEMLAPGTESSTQTPALGWSFFSRARGFATRGRTERTGAAGGVADGAISFYSKTKGRWGEEARDFSIGCAELWPSGKKLRQAANLKCVSFNLLLA